MSRRQILMTESYTDGVTSVLGEGHHRRRGGGGRYTKRKGIKKEIKIAGRRRKK